MKFTWFNLMPWPFLPDDFREQHRSVWVDLPNRIYDPVKGHDVYHTYIGQLEYAETLGFDGLGVNEHHANAYGLMPSPTSSPPPWRGRRRRRRWWCWAIPSRSTTRRSGWPRNSPCWT